MVALRARRLGLAGTRVRVLAEIGLERILAALDAEKPDFVVIDSRGRGAVTTKSLARALGDRNRGVGFDQLAEIRDAVGADFTLDFWNSDGTQAGACGNATRCVSDYVMRGLGTENVSLVTARGGLTAERAAERAGGLSTLNRDFNAVHRRNCSTTRSTPTPSHWSARCPRCNRAARGRAAPQPRWSNSSTWHRLKSKGASNVADAPLPGPVLHPPPHAGSSPYCHGPRIPCRSIRPCAWFSVPA